MGVPGPTFVNRSFIAFVSIDNLLRSQSRVSHALASREPMLRRTRASGVNVLKSPVKAS
jgi:hypothetical protein